MTTEQNNAAPAASEACPICGQIWSWLGGRPAHHTNRYCARCANELPPEQGQTVRTQAPSPGNADTHPDSAPGREPSAVEEVNAEATELSLTAQGEIQWRSFIPTEIALRHAEELTRLRAENAKLRGWINDAEQAAGRLQRKLNAAETENADLCYDNARLVEQASELATENGVLRAERKGMVMVPRGELEKLKVLGVSQASLDHINHSLAASERDQRTAVGQVLPGDGQNTSESPVEATPTPVSTAALHYIALGIEAAREVAYMHASDCAALGYSEKARTAATIVDLIEALQPAEVLAKNPTEGKP